MLTWNHGFSWLQVAATVFIVAVVSQKKLATLGSRWWAELNEVSDNVTIF